MKPIYFSLLIFVIINFSCKKTIEATANQKNENHKLSKIIWDSSFIAVDFSEFEYTNDKISKAFYRNTNAGDSSITYYEYSDDGTYIKGTDGSNNNYYTEWFLNNSKLPSKVIRHAKWFGNFQDNEYNFFYSQQTNHLDSITTNVNSDKPVLVSSIQYEGDNISRVIENADYENRKDTFYFTYDENPNAFREGEPLFYVYNLSQEYGLYYHALSIAEIFSKNMLNGYSYKSQSQKEKLSAEYSVVDEGRLKDFELKSIVRPKGFILHFIYK